MMSLKKKQSKLLKSGLTGYETEDELASIAAGRSPEAVQQEAEEAARKAEEARNPEPVDTTPQNFR